MPASFRVSTFAAAGAALFAAAAARGQAGTAPSVYLKNNAEGIVRGPSYNPEQLVLNQFNRQNCLSDESITFYIKAIGTAPVLASYHLEAWVGTSCDQASNRLDAAGTCAKLGEAALGETPVVLRLRDMARPLDIEGADADVCAGTPETPLDRNLYFLPLDSDSNPPPNATSGWFVRWAFKVDFVGPAAPVSITASPGHGSLDMSWMLAPNAPIDLKQYLFLCDPKPGSDVFGGAGAGADAPDKEGCGSTAFAPGDVPDASTIAAYSCGSADATETRGSASPLANGASYAVAIVARDSYYNMGPVSDAACATPVVGTSFYGGTRGAGSTSQRGARGGCELGRGPSHPLAALSVFGALSLLLCRRTRGRR